MSGLDFLSSDRAEANGDFSPFAVSPMAQAFAGGAPDGIEDISLTTGKLEVRGGVERVRGGEVVPISPERALVLSPYEKTASLRRRLDKAIDVTGALAGLRVERPDAERLLRRLTELDLERLPATGAVANMPATVVRDGPETFRLFFPQEYGHSMAEAVFDAAAGLEGARAPVRHEGGLA